MIRVVGKMLLTPKSVNNMLNTKFNIAGWRQVNPVRPMVLRRWRWKGEGKGRKQEQNSENFLFTTLQWSTNMARGLTKKKKKNSLGLLILIPSNNSYLLPSLLSPLAPSSLSLASLLSLASSSLLASSSSLAPPRLHWQVTEWLGVTQSVEL